jgi:hypothetical protein
MLWVLTSCKTAKNVTDTASIKRMAARKIVKKHLGNKLDITTLDARIRARYSSTKGDMRERLSLVVRLRIQKDSVIWIKANKVVTAFKAKITPDSFSFYSPIDKVYFKGDYTMLKNMLGIDVTFHQLQNLLLGQSIFEMKGKKFKAEIAKTSYKLTPKTQEELFNIFYKINPNHFKLDQLFLINEQKDKSLRIDYKGYKSFEETKAPIGIQINATEGMRYTFIDMDYKSIKFNTAISIPFRIPSNYKRITFK